jgi:SRSO17 transposase
MAAITAPERVSAQHQSMLHFISQGDWSDEKIPGKVREMVVPETERHGPIEVRVWRRTSIPPASAATAAWKY